MCFNWAVISILNTVLFTRFYILHYHQWNKAKHVLDPVLVACRRLLSSYLIPINESLSSTKSLTFVTPNSPRHDPIHKIHKNLETFYYNLYHIIHTIISIHLFIDRINSYSTAIQLHSYFKSFLNPVDCVNFS